MRSHNKLNCSFIKKADIESFVNKFGKSKCFTLNTAISLRLVLLTRAFAEGVVQQVADYLNPLDAPTLNVCGAASANTTNKSFGRRIKLVLFRRLSSKEV
jgi:hypothetical protein